MTSSKSRPPRRGLARRSTARAAPSATTCRSSAAPASSARFAPRAATRRAVRCRSRPTARRCSSCSPSPLHGCQVQLPRRGRHHRAPDSDSALWRGPGRSHSRRRILALADPDDRDRDGISGRAAHRPRRRHRRPRVGRFGWKAQHATLLAFGADAYRNEMGITNDLFRRGARRRADPPSSSAAAIRFPTPKIASIRRRGDAASTTSSRS